MENMQKTAAGTPTAAISLFVILNKQHDRIIYTAPVRRKRAPHDRTTRFKIVEAALCVIAFLEVHHFQRVGSVCRLKRAETLALFEELSDVFRVIGGEVLRCHNRGNSEFTSLSENTCGERRGAVQVEILHLVKYQRAGYNAVCLL